MKSVVKTLTTGLVLGASLVGCGPDALCPGVSSVDDVLASTCGVTATPDAASTQCTPAPGTICTVVGTGEAGIGTNGVIGTQSRIYLPQDVLVAQDGRDAYFIDWNNHVIRALRSDGRVYTVLGTGELSDGDDPPEMPMAMPMPQPALRTRLNHPTGMTWDAQGRMLVAAWHNSKIKRFNPSTMMVEDICGTGGRNFRGDGGPAMAAILDLPVGVAVNAAGDVFIADQANQRIRRVDGAGNINTIVGTGMRGYGGDGGPALMALLNNPIGQAAAPAGRIAVDSVGNLLIADTGNNRIRRVTPDGTITTLAGTGMAGHAGDNGPAAMAELNGPADIEVSSNGTLYIADTQNSCVRSIDSTGTIRTVAGVCGMRGFRGDGESPTTALLDRPYGVGTDSSGRLWIADTYNQRVRVILPR